MAVRATALLERRASVRVVWGLVVCGYFSAAVLAPVLFTYEEAVRVDLRQALEAPGPESWLGRDELGRRVDARIVWGARNSLTVSGVGVLLGGGLGVLVGTVAAYRRYSLLDGVLTTVVDGLLAVPRMLLALLVTALVGQSREGLTLAVALSSLPTFARLTRGAAMTVVEQEYVTAALAMGARSSWVLRRHVLPNIMPATVAYGSLSLANAVLIVTALGFLGLGVPPPAPEWGSMMSTARSYLWTHPHLTLVPGVVVALLTVSLSRLGDLMQR